MVVLIGIWVLANICFILATGIAFYMMWKGELNCKCKNGDEND